MAFGINWLDILFVILLVGMIYKGSRTGVGGQLISLTGWLILVFLSITYYDIVSRAIFGFLLQKWSRPISFFGITAIGFTVIKTLERVFNVIGSSEELPPVERVGGALVACLRACLFFGLIGMQLLIVPLDYTRDSVLDGSRTGKFFVDIDAGIYSWISEHVAFVKKADKEEIINEMMRTPTKER